MIKLLGLMLFMTPIIFILSLIFEDCDVWDAIKLTMAVDLGIACVGVGTLVMVDGGLLPL